jgi:hypothetical protein
MINPQQRADTQVRPYEKTFVRADTLVHPTKNICADGYGSVLTKNYCRGGPMCPPVSANYIVFKTNSVSAWPIRLALLPHYSLIQTHTAFFHHHGIMREHCYPGIQFAMCPIYFLGVGRPQ